MSEIVFWGAAVLAVAVVAWVLGARWGRGRYRAVLLQLARELRVRGDVPEGVVRDAPPEVTTFRESLQEALERRGRDPEAAVREALERVVGFLRTEVRTPLSRGLEGAPGDLREGARRAVAAVEDLGCFAQEPAGARAERRDLRKVVQEVTREYVGQWDVMVKVALPDAPVPVQVDPDAFMDALYLILHNAGRFGGGAAVSVTVEEGAAAPSVRIRDRGPGFDAEALERAYDPFYSTTPGGLGLGLPHARRLLHGQGGEITLRNHPEGGGEVEITLAGAA